MFNILQSDAFAVTVDFKNTIIILTSNLGSQYLLEGIDMEGNITDSAKSAVMGELHRAFRPEFLNRLDEMILFKPLTKDNLTGIIDIMVEGLRKRLADRSLELCITEGSLSGRVAESLSTARVRCAGISRAAWKRCWQEPSSPAISPRAVRSRWTSRTTNSSAGKTRKSCANESSYSFSRRRNSGIHFCAALGSCVFYMNSGAKIAIRATIVAH